MRTTPPQVDPTHTITLRKLAVADVNRRFNAVRRVVWETLVDNKALTTNAEAATAGRFVFLRNPEKVREFTLWLNDQVQTEILDTALNGVEATSRYWLNGYIGTGYVRGAQKTRTAFARRFADAGLIPKDSVFANPAHVERAELLYLRVYSQMKGVTEAMEQQMARVLSDGIVQGRGIRDIAKNLTKSVDNIGKVRARLIARTEIVNAHNTAAITEAERLEEVVGKTVMMKWMHSSILKNARQEHLDLNGKIMTKKKAQGLLGAPNCRCSVTAWLPEFGEV